MERVRALSVAVALLAQFAASGCASSGVCPAIAWSNTVDVNLNGNAAEVAVIELCVDGVCDSSSAVQQVPDEPLRLSTPGLQELQIPSQVPTVNPVMFPTSHVDDRDWRASFEMIAPETFTLRALSLSGDVLLERVFALHWRRAGGSEECGGPSEAGPVTLVIPS